MEKYRIEKLITYIYDKVDKSDNKENLKESVADVLRQILVPQTKHERILVTEMDTDDIKKLERRIVRIYEDCYFSPDKMVQMRAAACIDCLLMQRWRMMHDSIVWNDDFIMKLEVMNEKMKQALLDMRRMTLDTYNHLLSQCPDDKELEVIGTLWVDDMEIEGWKYGSHMWAYLSEILQTPEIGISNLYKYGVSMELTYNSTDYSYDRFQTELGLLYLEDKLDNWNEHMNREKTEHLHIIYGVHNMTDHSCWTFQDLINVKSYKTRIKVEYQDKMEIK